MTLGSGEPSLVAVVFLLVSVLIAVHEATRARRATFDFLFFFNVSFLIYFGLAPLHLLMGGESFAGLPNIYQDYFRGDRESESLLLKSAAIIVAVYGMVLFGFFGLASRTGVHLRLETIERRRVLAAISICGAVGAISLVLYVAQFPEWSSPFLKAAQIRSGAERTDGSLLFLRNVSPLLATAAVLVFAIWLDRTRGVGSYRLNTLLAVLILLGALAVLTQGSRRAWLIYALEFYLVAANYRGRTYAAWGAVLVVIGLALIIMGDLLALALATGGRTLANFDLASPFGNAGVLYAAVWRDFTLPYLETLAVIDRFEGLPRLFTDLPYAFLQLIPERILPLELPQPLSAETTLLITGIPVSAIAEVPPALIGFFWISGYLPGVVIGSLLFGLVGRKAETFLLDGARRQAVVMVLFTWCGFAWAYFMREGVPYMLLTERFPWFLAGLIILGVSRIRIERAQLVGRTATAHNTDAASPPINDHSG